MGGQTRLFPSFWCLLGGAVWELTWQILFLGSPLLLAAVAQGLCIRDDYLPQLKRPLDFGLSFKGKRIFGDHKTWRGLIINVVFCTLGTAIQARLQNKSYIPSCLLLLDYSKNGILAGILLGLGMTVGELPNSFLKRRLNISPGRQERGLLGVIFFLFDQIDLTIGIWIFLFFIIKPSLMLVLYSFLLTLILHILVSGVGYMLGMRKTIV